MLGFLFFLPPSALRYPVRSRPWCPRHSQPSPDLPGYSYGSFEHLTWEASWKVRARSSGGTAKALGAGAPCPSAKGVASFIPRWLQIFDLSIV